MSFLQGEVHNLFVHLALHLRRVSLHKVASFQVEVKDVDVGSPEWFVDVHAFAEDGRVKGCDASWHRFRSLKLASVPMKPGWGKGEVLHDFVVSQTQQSLTHGELLLTYGGDSIHATGCVDPPSFLG